jgi:ribonuclease HII
MPWIIGIDEAGYGPNLGPLVMTAVGCRVPDSVREPDLWRHLQRAVRRLHEEDDGRIVVEDSKLVYSPARGLADLERAAIAAMPRWPRTVHDLIGILCLTAAGHLKDECWYTGTSLLPVGAEPDACTTAAARFKEVCHQQSFHFGVLSSVVVSPAAFNATVERWGSKGAVLALAMADLVRRVCQSDLALQPVSFFIDKHGGRNYYAAALQAAFDDAMVLARIEGDLQSVYEVVGQARTIEVTFEPRADVSHFCVALASMVSKYLRELLMLEFNRFWQEKVPGLKPTAGYPVDSRRFWNDIARVVKKMNIPEASLWRSR